MQKNREINNENIKDTENIKGKEKTYVEDIDRSIYDFKNKEDASYKVKEGLTPEIVEKISKEKNDPPWMELFRLRSLQMYNSMEVPD